MRLNTLFQQKQPVVSHEIFPPKMETPLETILQKLDRFAAMSPDFISVTYGAGGSGKGRTIELASRLKQTHGVESMAHFTCVGHSVAQIDEMIAELQAQGIENILALRGDPPRDQPNFDFSKNVFRYAGELIAHIKTRADFCIAAAAYVEGHVDAHRVSEDLVHLREKVSAGVDFLVTQLFFDNRQFHDFMERIRVMGIGVPVTAGIMPVLKADQIKRIASLAGASLPAGLVLMMDKYGDNPEDMRKAGVDYAAAQIRDLVDNGVAGIHVLTMNRPEETEQILRQAGLWRQD
jgi:methylenetetrahydrofolate reductase (NADPH)